MDSTIKWTIAGGIFLVGVIMTVVIVLCSRSYKRRKKVSTTTPHEVSRKDKNKVKNKNTSRAGRGHESEVNDYMYFKPQNKTVKNGLEYRRFTNQRRTSDQKQSDQTKMYIDIEIPKVLIPRVRLERSLPNGREINLYPAELK